MEYFKIDARSMTVLIYTTECIEAPLYFHGREATDSYTIAASPSFGILGQLSFLSQSRNSLELDAKSPLLAENEKLCQKEDLDKISRAQSSLSEKASFPTGELPIGHGCSFTQTVFNGKPCHCKTLLLLFLKSFICPDNYY